MLEKLTAEIKKIADPQRAGLLARYFRTGKGQYGEGDVFLGLTVPQSRFIASKFPDLILSQIGSLLQSPYHEYRLIAILILVSQFTKALPEKKQEIVNFYLNNTARINNWDLVDLSAPKIVGEFYAAKDKSKIYELARSVNLWEKRISILATFGFIRNGDMSDALKICRIHLNDRHDLIHKAAGWMLREIGKKDLRKEEAFLDKYAKIMPRTMLRYAIEKFPDKKRIYYLRQKEARRAHLSA